MMQKIKNTLKVTYKALDSIVEKASRMVITFKIDDVTVFSINPFIISVSISTICLGKLLVNLIYHV